MKHFGMFGAYHRSGQQAFAQEMFLLVQSRWEEDERSRKRRQEEARQAEQRAAEEAKRQEEARRRMEAAKAKEEALRKQKEAEDWRFSDVSIVL